MVSANTVLLNLQKFKDLFVRVDKWVYALVEDQPKAVVKKTK
jgi:hypothetical protein